MKKANDSYDNSMQKRRNKSKDKVISKSPLKINNTIWQEIISLRQKIVLME